MFQDRDTKPYTTAVTSNLSQSQGGDEAGKRFWRGDGILVTLSDAQNRSGEAEKRRGSTQGSSSTRMDFKMWYIHETQAAFSLESQEILTSAPQLKNPTHTRLRERSQISEEEKERDGGGGCRAVREDVWHRAICLNGDHGDDFAGGEDFECCHQK